jgi:hypothetical protein
MATKARSPRVTRNCVPSAPIQTDQPWHICDHVFEPITTALEEIINAEEFGDLTGAKEAERSLLRLQHSDDVLYAGEWLSLYFTRLTFSPRGMVEELLRRLSPLLVHIADWEQTHHVAMSKGENTLQIDQRRQILLNEWRSFCHDVVSGLLKLRFYSDQLRAHIRFDAPPAKFFMTDLQNLIIRTLFRSPLTLEQLEIQLGKDRKTILAPGRRSNNPEQKGGLTELLRLGIVTNDSTRGGYYLPTAPPA